jgi:hypothetical protein
LFSYVESSMSLSLSSYVHRGAADDWKLELFADANLGGSDHHTKSTSGSILFITAHQGMTRMPLSWASGKQTRTASSTAEAELIALTRAAQNHLLPAEQLWDELLSRQIPSVTREDNAACLAIVASGFSAALRFLPKHQRLSVGVSSEICRASHRQITHATSKEQRADFLTKGLTGPSLSDALVLAGLIPKGTKLPNVYFEMCKGSPVFVKDEDGGDGPGEIEL